MIFRSVLLSAVCGTAPLAHAQSVPAPFLLGGEYQTEADVDDGGSFSRQVARARASAPLYTGEDAFLALSVGYQFESFEFDDLADDPWGDINRTRVGLIAKQDLNNGWSWLALPFFQSNGENDSDFGDSITVGTLALAWYKLSDTLTLGLGGGISGNLEDSVSVFPILVINWEFAPNWTLTTVPPDGFRLGPGASLRWDFREDVSFSLVYQYQSDQQRLDDTASAGFAERIDGIGELRQHRVALTSTYHFTDHLSLTGHIGLALGGEIEIQNSSGRELEKSDFDSTLVFGFEGSWNF